MAQFINEFEVDLKKPMAPQPLRQCVGEGDAYGMQVGARVFNDGEYIALGGSCVGKVIRADGATIQLTGTISGNLAYVVLDQTCCAVEGPLQVAVCWVQNTAVTTLLVAYGTVVNTQTGTAIQPSTPIPDLTQLLAEIDEMRAATAAAEAAAEDVLQNFALLFSESTAYKAGDFVTYEAEGWQFYRFITDHAPGAWDSLEVRPATVGMYLSALQDSSLTYLPVSASSAETAFSKLASNLPGNTFCWVSSEWFTDLPSGTYWLFTLADTAAYETFAAQYIYIPDTGVTYTRRRLYSGNAWTWTDWVMIYLYKGVLTSGTDLNSVTSLGIHGLSTAGNYGHRPGGFSSGYLVALDYGAGYVTQFALDYYDGTKYTRAYTGTAWTDWVCEGIHDTGAKYFAFGDSVVWGQIGGSSPAAQSKNNYPALTGRLLHMQTVNKAVPGQGLIKDWDTIHSSYISGLDMTGAKLITIGWDYNDSGYYSGMDFGAPSDTGSTTFLGKYFTILKEFQQKCPDARLILVTGYGTPDGQVGPPVVKPTLETQWTYLYTFADGQKNKRQIYDALEEMCHLHGWSCVNQAHGTALNPWNADDLIGDQIHLTDAGYLVYGNHIAARIASMWGNIAAWL